MASVVRVVSTEPAATAMSTCADSSIPADADKSESPKERVSATAAAVWAIYKSAAAARFALTQAAWQSVWDWQATPGSYFYVLSQTHASRDQVLDRCV